MIGFLETDTFARQMINDKLRPRNPTTIATHCLTPRRPTRMPSQEFSIGIFRDGWMIKTNQSDSAVPQLFYGVCRKISARLRAYDSRMPCSIRRSSSGVIWGLLSSGEPSHRAMSPLCRSIITEGGSAPVNSATVRGIGRSGRRNRNTNPKSCSVVSSCKTCGIEFAQRYLSEIQI